MLLTKEIVEFKIFDENGNFISSFGSHGSHPGKFQSPSGISIDGEGKIVVADTGKNSIQIFDGNFNFLKEIHCKATHVCVDFCGNIICANGNSITIFNTGLAN